MIAKSFSTENDDDVKKYFRKSAVARANFCLSVRKQ